MASWKSRNTLIYNRQADHWSMEVTREKKTILYNGVGSFTKKKMEQEIQDVFTTHIQNGGNQHLVLSNVTMMVVGLEALIRQSHDGFLEIQMMPTWELDNARLEQEQIVWKQSLKRYLLRCRMRGAGVFVI